MADPIPAGVRQLLDHLGQRGYSLAAEERSEAFGNHFLELAAGPASSVPRIRVIRERGIWDVELEVAGEFHTPYMLVLALNGAPYTSRALSHDERATLTLEALSRLSEDATDTGELHANLRRLRTEYSQQLFGTDRPA